MDLLIHGRSFVPIPRFHGHANQSRDAGAGANQLDDRHLLCVDALRSEARPHVIGERKWRELLRKQVFMT